MTPTFQKIWINKHLDDKFNSSQFNPQPKTTTGLTGPTRVPGLGPLQKRQLYEFTVTISGWFMGLYLGH